MTPPPRTPSAAAPGRTRRGSVGLLDATVGHLHGIRGLAITPMGETSGDVDLTGPIR